MARGKMIHGRISEEAYHAFRALLAQGERRRGCGPTIERWLWEHLARVEERWLWEHLARVEERERLQAAQTGRGTAGEA